MTKRDLVVRIANETTLNQRDVSDVVQKTLDYIVEELGAGRGVELRNFGVFTLKTRKSRVGRNPNDPTNEVPIPERIVVKFKPGKVMQDQVGKLNGGGKKRKPAAKKAAAAKKPAAKKPAAKKTMAKKK